MTELPGLGGVDHPKIEIYSDDESLIAQAARALGAYAGCDVVVGPVADFLRNAGNDPSTALIVLDIDDGTILNQSALHEARRRMDESISLVIVSRGITVERLREVVRLGASDSIHKPLDLQDFVETIAKSLKQVRSTARVVAFVSTSAGSGATTLTMNAAYLAATRPAKGLRAQQGSILLDLDFSLAAAANFLDIANEYDFRDVLDNPTRIDAEMVDIIRKQHDAGFSLLSIKAPVLFSHPAGSEVVLRILDILNFHYGNVLVDIPYYTTPWRSAVLGGVNDVVLVTESTIPALKQARIVEKELLRLRDSGSVVIAVNRHRSGILHSSLSKKEIARVFEDRQFELLPDASELIEECANQGRIPLEFSSKSRYGRRVGKFLSQFL